MKLFEMVNWDLRIREEAWSLLAFKSLLDRDKSKNKDTVMKEMSFIYFFADIRSDYAIISDSKVKIEEIKKDVGLPEDWVYDDLMIKAVELYKDRSETITSKLYNDAMTSANAVGEYLRNTDYLLKERDDNGKVVTTVATITSALNGVNKLMKELKILEKEVIKETKELEGRTKGSQTMSIFEEGLNFED